MLSDVMEDYLKVIYQRQQRGDDRIGTSELAEALDVTSPTVTSTVEKLAERGLVDREKYQGVRLTEEGEAVALEVVRHHRLLEAYLSEHLDYDWSEVHDEADRLEHHISEEFEDRLAHVLDEPEVDPHGSPIPGADLDPPEPLPGDAISRFSEDDVVVVEEVSDEDPDVLSYLAAHGVEPGVTLRITEIAPFGMISVSPVRTDRSVSLPTEVANEVHVSVPAETRS